MPTESSSVRGGWMVYTPPVLLAVLLAFSWYLMRREADGRDALRQGDRVRLSVTRSLSALQGAESAQRGYILTGRPDYLNPFLASRDSVIKDLNDLELITKDEEEQQRYMQELRPIVMRRLARLDSIVGLRQRGVSLDTILATAGLPRGRALMDSARFYFGHMWGVESRILLLREEKVKRDRRTMQFALVIGILVTGLVSLFVSNRLANDATRHWLMSAELRARLDMLKDQSGRTSGETRGTERTTPTSSGAVPS